MLLRSLWKRFFDKPIVKKSTLEDVDDKAFEQDQFYEEWKIDYAEYKKEVKTFEANMAKAYAMIYKNYCAKEVQYNIEEISNFKTRIKIIH